jgi:hypothetical protein
VAYLLRTVSHSAEGREIVRTARIEGDVLTVGRDPASNVHLTDLAVALQHAVITRTSPTRLDVLAGEGLTLELSGRSVGGGAIHLGQGGDLRIGSHILRFMPAEAGASDIDVNIERVTEGEAALGKADERRFSLVSVMPGKRPLAWLLAAMVLVVFLAWPVNEFYQRREREQAAAERYNPDRMWLSGHLSGVHKGLENNCTACHAEPFVAVRDAECQACHTRVHDHADKARLARARPDLDRWGRFRLAVQETFGVPAGRCVDCHTEHEGPQEMAPTPQRFCSDCHTALTDRLPDTRLGNAGDFGTSTPNSSPPSSSAGTMKRRSCSASRSRTARARIRTSASRTPSISPAPAASRRWGGGSGGSTASAKASSAPTATCPRPTARASSRSTWKATAPCATTSPSTRSAAPTRTLRHGSPEQVVADLREYFRGRVPPRPSILGPDARRRPGDVMQIRNTIQYARAVQGAGSAADQAIRSRLRAQRRLLRLPRRPTPAARQFARLPDPPRRLSDALHAARLVRSPPARADRVRDLPQCGGLAIRERPPAPQARNLPDLPRRRELRRSPVDLRHVPRLPYGRRHARHAAAPARARPALGDDDHPRHAAARCRHASEEGPALTDQRFLIAQITDVHLGFDQGNPDEYNRQRLDRTLRAFMEMQPRPDMLLITGDLAEEGDDSDSYARLKEALAPLPSRSTWPWAITTAAVRSSKRFRIRPGRRLHPIRDRRHTLAYPRPRHAGGRPPRRRLLREFAPPGCARASMKRRSGRP